jgi:hypothetical protein
MNARLAAAATLAMLVAAPLLAGPPWISVEIPANPIQRLLADLVAGRTPEPLTAAGFGGMGAQLATVASAGALALMILSRLVPLAARRLRAAAA